MKKIVLACFWHQETNIGDKSYIETFKKLVDLYTENVTIELCDFYGRSPVVKQTEEILQTPIQNYTPSSVGKIKNFIRRTISNTIKLLIGWTPAYDTFQKNRMKKSKYNKIYRYYQDKLKDADALIIPGGGLVEYSSWRDYYYLLEMLQKICRKNKINMYINSVGYVENEDPKTWIKRWKKILNNKYVKHFTCRDNLPFFKKLRPQSVQVPCTACLSSDVFNLSKDENSNVIGIGLMRHDAYDDYGNNFSKAFLLDYYKKVIDEILSRNYKVALFSVGVIRDQDFGEELIKHFNTDDVVLYERPLDVATFLNQVSTFKAILTVRTHSAYAAFSLDVPAIMIYFGTRGWSGKSNEFMSMMGVTQNAVCCDNVSPAELVEKLEAAIKLGWNKEVMLEKKKMCYQNFFEIMNKIGVLKPDVNTEAI